VMARHDLDLLTTSLHQFPATDALRNPVTDSLRVMPVLARPQPLLHVVPFCSVNHAGAARVSVTHSPVSLAVRGVRLTRPEMVRFRTWR
jgi:hypothetical protein